MTSPRHVPFRDLELTVEEEQHCHDRAFQLLDRTLRSYDERDGQGEGRPTAPRHHSELDNTQWKLLKTQNDASMYIERNNRAQRDLNLLDGGWENPVVLLTAGTIRGDLDEVMLGMETPDFASLKTRSEIFTNQAVDGAVLSKLSSSTEDDPFRYMAVHWQMFEHLWPLNKMVSPRDFVSIASIGTMTRTNGERIGYEVVLPANLSRYPPLPKPFVRGMIMYTVIFKQLEPGIVDVYLHTVEAIVVNDGSGHGSNDKVAEITTPESTEASVAAPSPITTSVAPPTSASPTPTTATLTGMHCGFQIKNTYYHGFNLKTVNVDDATECCDLCTAYDGCVLYTYFYSSSTGQSICYLKSGAGEKTNYADSSSVTAVSAFMTQATQSPTPTITPTPTTVAPSICNEQLERVFYNDYTIYEFTIDSVDECCEYCSLLASKGCVLYSLYVSKSEGVKRCLLKSAAGEATNYTNSDDLTVVSAFLIIEETPAPTPTTECTVAEGQYCGNAQGTTCCESDSYCQPWNTNYYQCIELPDGCSDLETDVDYYGNDLSSALTLYPWLCCSLCQETEGCNAYTFVNLDPAGPTCYMKTSAAGRVASIGALSGVPIK
ncbi:hypothetical protein JM18_008477 [Phytophthora kernoviae]|uniref:Apple domain-containing protein n=2 Tax=Phytophthora kernoviae TaxID=325452 RepID=A0A8T0LUQ8_9STRA|nr:hypothetical protein JM18_008477 [Phytophthora kernoviae]KAG2521900.1 hypothetical protein JM16_004921 [Phytophthora kernoviae]